MLRSCYSSVWDFPGHGNIPGYFYFNDDAEPYPGLTYFGSRNWHAGDGTPWPDFGEREDTQQVWRNGSFAISKPLVKILGTAEQVEGEADCPEQTWQLLHGVPAPCWELSLDDTYMIIREVDGVPTYTHVSTLSFDQADGFALSQPSPDEVRIDINAVSEAGAGVISAMVQTDLGGANALTRMFTQANVRHVLSIAAAVGATTTEDRFALSGTATSGLHETFLWGARDKITFEIGESNFVNFKPAFYFGGRSHQPVDQVDFDILVRTAPLTWATAASATIAGMIFAKGLYTGGAFLTTTASISDYVPATDTLIGAAIAALLADPNPFPQYALLSDPNPFPVYLTQAEGDALYAPIGVTQYTDEQAQDAVGGILVGSGDVPLSYADGVPSITATLANVGTAGTYPKVTTDSKGRVTAGAALAVADLPPFNDFAGASTGEADSVPFYSIAAGANRMLTIADIRKLCTPPGTILPYAGGTIPSGFLACDGAAVSRTTFVRLFAAIGTTWNTFRGQGAPAGTDFRVPHLIGLATLGQGAAVAGGGGVGATSARALAAGGGVETHTLVTGEMPAHTHTYLDVTVAGAIPFSLGVTGSFGAGPTGSTGGGGSHQNMQPFAAITWMIKD